MKNKSIKEILARQLKSHDQSADAWGKIFGDLKYLEGIESDLSSSDKDLVARTKKWFIDKFNTLTSRQKTELYDTIIDKYNLRKIESCMLDCDLPHDISTKIFVKENFRALAQNTARLLEPLEFFYKPIEWEDDRIQYSLNFFGSKPHIFINMISGLELTNSEKSRVIGYLNESNRFGVTNFRKIVKSGDLGACKKAIDLGAKITDRDIEMAKTPEMRDLLNQNRRGFWSNFVQNCKDFELSKF